MGHLDTEDYDLSVPDIDLELNYGTDFLKIHNVIEKRLNKPNDAVWPVTRPNVHVSVTLSTQEFECLLI